MSQVLVDNAGASNHGLAVSSLDITGFVVGTGSDRLLIVGVSWFDTTASRTVTLASSTWNGSQTFSQWDAADDGANQRKTIILYLKNPASATGTIHIVFSGAVAEVIVGATSWSVVDQTTPLGTAVKAGGTTLASDTITISSAVGNVVHDIMANDAGATLSAPDHTQRWAAQCNTSTSEGGGQSAAGAATVALKWTFVTTGGSFAHIGFDIKASTSVKPVGPFPTFRPDLP